jgi:hypothetical protein
MKRLFPIILFLTFLGIHLFIMNDYGFTWDFHHHFFAGGWFLGMKPETLEPRPLPYLLPDPREAVKLPYGPLVQIIPTVSWITLYKTFHLLPADSAYHLPIVLSGILGILILYLFIKEAFGWMEGVIAAIFLFLTPRFFSDLHNDMKDVPSASVFALNMWLLFRLVKYQRVKDLILASLGFMLAFNTKVNAIFIPIIFAAFLFIQYIFQENFFWRNARGEWKKFRRSLPELKNVKLIHAMSIASSGARNFFYEQQRAKTKNLLCEFSAPITTNKFFFLLSYFLLAPLLAFLLWTLFWGDGIGQIKLMFITFGIGTNNIEVLLNNTIYLSGVNVPWYYAPWYLIITTPLPILIFFIIGTLWCLYLAIMKQDKASLLLLLWCFLPLARYLSPKTGVLDGVRHFEEVLFPIAAFAAIASVSIARYIEKTRIGRLYIRQLFITAVAINILVTLTLPIIEYHPFQITYFNEIVGGIRGAYGKYDLDYWGASQKYAINWVNATVPKGAVVNVVMAGNVAGAYLRDDLIPTLNATDFLQSEYVVVLNRQSFFNRYIAAYPIGEYVRTHTPIYTVTNQGIPLVWVYKN